MRATATVQACRQLQGRQMTVDTTGKGKMAGPLGGTGARSFRQRLRQRDTPEDVSAPRPGWARARARTGFGTPRQDGGLPRDSAGPQAPGGWTNLPRSRPSSAPQTPTTARQPTPTAGTEQRPPTLGTEQRPPTLGTEQRQPTAAPATATPTPQNQRHAMPMTPPPSSTQGRSAAASMPAPQPRQPQRQWRRTDDDDDDLDDYGTGRRDGALRRKRI